jgi:catechol 1,2-dioxygenase
MGQMIPDFSLRMAADAKARVQKSKKQQLSYDPYFTEKVIAATGPNAHPRLAQVMPSLVRHLHDFAREVNLTVAEWTAAVDMVWHSHSLSVV